MTSEHPSITRFRAELERRGGTGRVVVLPVDLLARARKSTGDGITGTIRRGLEMVAARRAQDELRKLRGRVKFSIEGRGPW